MLRVIAGKYRGRHLVQPPHEITRATKDRVREGIFNSIQFAIPGTVVLDLFAGSGAMAIEFLSRGAAKALAIDESEAAVRAMQTNKTALNITNLTIIQGRLPEQLDELANTRYDFIVLDAPYAASGLTEACLAKIVALKLLKPLGLIIVEMAAQSRLTLPPALIMRRTFVYGNTQVGVVANIL